MPAGLNESAAVANLRTINTAQVTYLSSSGGTFGATTDLVHRIVERLETQELNRTRWIASHQAAGSSLAAAVAIRWMEGERQAGRDPDAALEASVRALIAELPDDASAPSA